MVTGDYSVTAASIANQVGILTELKYDTYAKLRENVANRKALKKSIILNGQEITKLTKEEWKIICCDYTEVILSRSTPKHKLVCARELQTNGFSVLMVGDGVNDVPALKQADLSVAMSTGSKLATDIANIVLLDNSFYSLVELLLIGRQTFYNIKKLILLSFISSIFSQNVATLVNGIFGLPQLYTSFQMTIVSAFTDLLPSISLFFEKAEFKVMVKRSHENLIDKRLLIMVFFFFGPLTTFFAFLSYFLYFKYYAGLNPSDLAYNFFSNENQSMQDIVLTGQTVAFYSIVVMQAFGNLYSIRTRRLLFIDSLPFAQAHRNLYLIAASLLSYVFATLCVSFSIQYFTSSIPGLFYGLPLAYSLLIILIDELRKYFLPKSTFIQKFLSW
jgi:sodium/potassium-transporting ATPase subunit alpha